MTNIKKQFPEFYQEKLEKIDLKSESENLIIFDTNFLLDILQSPTDIGKKYIDSLKRVQDNIYIPYLVALEFNFRKSGIKKEKHYNITKYRDVVEGNLKTLKESISDHQSINIKKNTEDFSSDLLEEVEKFQEHILKKLDKKIATYITEEENTIYKELINIVENNIGEKYTQEWIAEVESEGENRYKDKIPPGFDDEEKEDTEEDSRRYSNLCYQRKYGDLIIWKDIINYSKNSSKKGVKVIYVTNDGQSSKKSDLLYKVKKLIVGPHIFLMNELQMEANKELYILSNLRFVQLVTEISDSQIEEIKHMAESWKQQEFLTADANKLAADMNVRKQLMDSFNRDTFDMDNFKRENLNMNDYLEKALIQNNEKKINTSELERIARSIKRNEERLKKITVELNEIKQIKNDYYKGGILDGNYEKYLKSEINRLQELFISLDEANMRAQQRYRKSLISRLGSKYNDRLEDDDY